MNLKTALSESNLTKTVTALHEELPEREDRDPVPWLLNEIEDRFWRTITGQSEPPEEYVFYDQLAVETPVIGYVEAENDENGSQLPWWLESFEWQFEMIGQETLELPNYTGEIDRVKEFDPSKTQVYRPELIFNENGSDLQSLLKGLEAIKNELINSADIEQSERTVYEDSQDHPQLPADIFELPNSNPIRTTQEFKNWLQSVLELCPPYNETTTALTWYNTGLPQRAMEAMLGDDVTHLERAGLAVGTDRVWNHSYREAIAQIMGFRGVFDWDIQFKLPDQFPMVNSLETAYIQEWLSKTHQLNAEQEDALRLAASLNRTSEDKNNEMEYAPHCIELPISYNKYKNKDNRYLTFDTQRRGYNGGLYAEYESQAEAIIQAIEQAGLLQEANE